MKVICIEETFQMGNIPTPSPVVGSEYNIVRRFYHKGFELCELSEFPRKDGFLFAYGVEAFAPLDGPDERERLEAYQSEHLTKEDKLLMVLAEASEEVEMPQDSFERVWKNISRTL